MDRVYDDLFPDGLHLGDRLSFYILPNGVPGEIVSREAVVRRVYDDAIAVEFEELPEKSIYLPLSVLEDLRATKKETRRLEIVPENGYL